MATISRGWLWSLVLAAALSVGAATYAAGLSIEMGDDYRLPGMLVSTVLLLLYSTRFTDPGIRKVAATFEMICLFSLISVIGTIATYSVASVTSGYTDAMMVAIDRTLGFDWLWLYRLEAGNPWLASVAHAIYVTIFITPAIVLVALVWSGRTDRARVLLLAFGIALSLTILLFALFPAQSALVYLVGLDPPYLPATGIDQAATIDALRSGALRTIDIRCLGGLIGFPSFHCIAALLMIWGAWPVRRIRLPVLLAEGAMLAATPVEGAHYLADMLGGIGVTAVTIGLLHLPGLAQHRPRTAEGVLAAT